MIDLLSNVLAAGHAQAGRRDLPIPSGVRLGGLARGLTGEALGVA